MTTTAEAIEPAEMALIRRASQRLREGSCHVARDVARAAIELNPTSVWAAKLLGDCEGAMGHTYTAHQWYRAAARGTPRTLHEQLQRSIAWRYLGEWERAAADWMEGSEMSSPRWGDNRPPLRGWWRGEPLNGGTLLVRHWDGNGDAIEWARYLPLLSRFGGRVVAEAPGSLVELLRCAPLGVEIVEQFTPIEFDEHVLSSCLPAVLGIGRDSVPAADGYLVAPGAVECERHCPPRRVGIAWAGSVTLRRDRERSMPVEALARLVRGTPGVEWVSVMHPSHPRAGEAEGVGMFVPAGWLDSYSDTARLLSGLDLLVTVDTSVAHLAGALGVPVWTLLPCGPNDPRWGMEGSDTPLYRSMRLWRQRGPDEWMGLVERVGVAVVDWDSDRG